MIAHIIMSNDNPEAVVLCDYDEAVAVMDKLCEEYYETCGAMFSDRETYDHVIHWHIRNVEVVE